MSFAPVPSKASSGATEVVPLRFEDVTQDGRLALEALPNAFGTLLWRDRLPAHPLVRTLRERGIIAILTRFVLEGRPGPFSALTTLHTEANIRIAFSGDGRLVLDAWGDAHGPIGTTYGTTARSGETTLAGRILAEHTFTRLFGAPGTRRVSRHDVADLAAEIGERPASPPAESTVVLPESAQPLDQAPGLDPFRITFGIVHTDSNQHVNSLVYLRVFEEGALRRFAELGRPTAVLARTLDIAYRKPCLAGQTMRLLQQAFVQDGKLGVAACLVPDVPGAPEGVVAAGLAHTFARMTFEP